MKKSNSRALFECASLEARRMFCLSGDHVGVSTSPSFDGGDQLMPASSSAFSGGPESIDTLIVPGYSSRPGATRKLYLDFNGHGSIDNWGGWWEFGGESVSATQAYDIDGDNNSYSTQELANILQIWKGVSEKFSPFNIDVTTIRPSTINGVRVVIGGDGAWHGTGGGVGLRGGWGEEGFTDINSGNVAFVWDGQMPSSPNYIIDAASHEAGHTLDLYHQSLPPIATNEYAPGLIMGSGGAGARWGNTAVNGTVASSRDDDGVHNEGSQNDLTRITGDNGFGFRADDFGNTIGVATTLTLSSGSGVLEGNASGVIEQMTDADVFRISHTGGSLDVEVLAAEFGRMLDPRMELLNSAGGLIQFSASNNASDGFGERISLNQLNAGTYYISIFSSTAYGDIGQYRLNVRAGLATTAFNDTVGTATRLFAFGNTDAASWGSIGYAGTATINDSVASNDTIDYFKFRAPTNTNSIYVRLSGLTTSASVALYNDLNGNGVIETGEILGATNPGTGVQVLTNTFISADTNYYVRVMKASAAASGNYQLRITADAAPSSLPASVPSATYDPQPLRGGKTVYESIDAAVPDTVDYFRIKGEAAGLISLYMSDWGFTGDLRLDVGTDTNANGLLDAGEITSSSAQVGGSSEFIQNIPIAQDQQLLVRISQQAAGASDNYSLTAIADYATGGNTNGSLVGARDLTLVSAATIFEYFDASVDFFDTFRIAPPTGTMQARFNAIDLGASHKLEIIRDANNNGAVDAGEIVASGFTGQLLSHNVTAGATYYLRMQAVSGGEFFSTGNYRLVYNTAGAINSFTTPGTAGGITVGPTQSALSNTLQFDPTDPTRNNTEDYYRFTLATRSRFDVTLNSIFLPPPASFAQMGVALGRDDGSGNFQRIGGVGKNQGIVTNLSVNLDPGTYLIRAYLPVEERQQDASGGSYSLLFKTAAVTDNAGPVVTAAAFQYEIKSVGPSFTLDQDIAGSVDVNDVLIQNVAIPDITPTVASTFYDPATRRVGYTVLGGTLADGNWRAILKAGSVRDASANPLAADVTLNFFVLAGDANRDRRVNLDDFTTLAANFGLAGKTFSQGDFNYSHAVDLDDFTLLASRFGTVLPAAAGKSTTAADSASSAAISPTETPRSRVGARDTSIFSEVLLPAADIDSELM